MATLADWVILFGGAGREVCILRMLSSGVKIRAVIVPKHRNAKLNTALERLHSLPCPILEVAKDELSDTLAAYLGSPLLSIGFPYILPEKLLSLFNPAVNIHPTLLPCYRGPTTGAYILINKEKESGSTVHHMSAQMDAGDIVAQSSVSLTPFDTVRSLQRKVYETEPDLVIKAISLLEKNIEHGSPQDELCATEYPRKRLPTDSEIDPSLPLSQLFDYIRACDPQEFPAYFMYNNEKVFIKLWRTQKPDDESDLI